MLEPVNYVVPRYGPGAGPFVKAIRFAEALTAVSRDLNDLVIVCGSRKWFLESESGEYLVGLLGSGSARRLAAGERVSLGAAATLRLESLRTLRNSAPPQVALVQNADESLLAALSYFDRVDVVVGIGYKLSCIESWIKREAASIPGTPVTATGALEDWPIVAEALLALTYMVNHTETWASEDQKKAAIEILWSVYTRGCRPKSGEVKRWALLNGWSRKGAELLGGVAKEVEANRAYPAELGLFWWDDTFKILNYLYRARLSREAREKNA